MGVFIAVALLTVWHRPVYFISTKTSFDRTSSRMTSWSVNGAPGFSTTNAVVGICFSGIIVEVTVEVTVEVIVEIKCANNVVDKFQNPE